MSSQIARRRPRPRPRKKRVTRPLTPAKKELKDDGVVCIRLRVIITIIDADRLFRQLALNRNYRCAIAASISPVSSETSCGSEKLMFR